MGCYGRAKGWNCPQKSAPLEEYEQQIRAYLETFYIPEDYQEKILAMEKQLHQNFDAEKERKQLKARLDRIKDLYSWGDITKEKYLTDKRQLDGDLARLAPMKASTATLERTAAFLTNVVKAWDAATQEQRNTLVRTLFQEIWVKDQQVVAVKPQPVFEPFFKLNWEQYKVEIMKWRPRGDSNP